MAVQVNPEVARKGRFLETFLLRERDQMLGFCAVTEEAMARNGVDGTLVFTQMAVWGKSRRQQPSSDTCSCCSAASKTRSAMCDHEERDCPGRACRCACMNCTFPAGYSQSIPVRSPPCLATPSLARPRLATS